MCIRDRCCSSWASSLPYRNHKQNNILDKSKILLRLSFSCISPVSRSNFFFLLYIKYRMMWLDYLRTNVCVWADRLIVTVSEASGRRRKKNLELSELYKDLQLFTHTKNTEDKMISLCVACGWNTKSFRGSCLARKGNVILERDGQY